MMKNKFQHIASELYLSKGEKRLCFTDLWNY